MDFLARMGRSIVFYSRVVWFEAQRYAVYKNELIGLLLGRLAPVTIMLVFWSIVSKSSDVPLNQAQVFAYFLILSGIIEVVGIRNFQFGGSIAQSIERGTLSADLLRPFSIVPVLAARNFGRTLPYKLLSVGFIIAGVSFVEGFGLYNVAAAALFVLIAIGLSLSINIVMASLAFWLTRVDALRLIIYFTFNIFTGLYIPLYLMPEAVQQAVFMSPIAYFAYLPTALLTGSPLYFSLFVHAIIAFVWMVILNILARFMWRRGLKKYDAVGA